MDTTATGTAGTTQTAGTAGQDTTATGTAAGSTGTTDPAMPGMTATTTGAAGQDTTSTAAAAAEGLTIYDENRSTVGAMNAFQNYGGIGVFVNIGQKQCQSQFYQAPMAIATAIKSCTHQGQYSDISTIVQKCESLPKDACKQDNQCMSVLMAGEVEPSTAMMTCTHSSIFNMDQNVVSMCQSSQDKLGCVTNNVEPSTAAAGAAPYVIRCIWNECSQQGTPACPTQEEMCTSINGPSAPGYCLRTTAKMVSTQE